MGGVLSPGENDRSHKSLRGKDCVLVRGRRLFVSDSAVGKVRYGVPRKENPQIVNTSIGACIFVEIYWRDCHDFLQSGYMSNILCEGINKKHEHVISYI